MSSLPSTQVVAWPWEDRWTIIAGSGWCMGNYITPLFLCNISRFKWPHYINECIRNWWIVTASPPIVKRRFWLKFDLGQKYYAPQVRPDRGSNSWPQDHHSTVHVTETPALTIQPSVISSDNVSNLKLGQPIANGGTILFVIRSISSINT